MCGMSVKRDRDVKFDNVSEALENLTAETRRGN